MWCHRCGKPLSVESKFCNACGVGVSSNQPTTNTFRHSSISIPFPTPSKDAIQAQPHSEEKVIFRIRPSFYAVGKAYVGAALFSILAIAVFGYLNLPMGISLVLSLVSFIFPLARNLQRNRMVYTLTPSKIEVDSGIFSKTVRNIPLRNAQDVTVSATLLGRVIKVGDVIIDSATEIGSIQMHQIPDPRKHANLILQQLQQLHR